MCGTVRNSYTLLKQQQQKLRSMKRGKNEFRLNRGIQKKHQHSKRVSFSKNQKKKNETKNNQPPMNLSSILHRQNTKIIKNRLILLLFFLLEVENFKCLTHPYLIVSLYVKMIYFIHSGQFEYNIEWHHDYGNEVAV